MAAEAKLGLLTQPEDLRSDIEAELQSGRVADVETARLVIAGRRALEAQAPTPPPQTPPKPPPPNARPPMAATHTPGGAGGDGGFQRPTAEQYAQTLESYGEDRAARREYMAKVAKAGGLKQR